MDEKEKAWHELEEIGKSFTRLMNQVEKSSIADEIKKPMLDDLQEMAGEVHHLVPIEMRIKGGEGIKMEVSNEA